MSTLAIILILVFIIIGVAGSIYAVKQQQPNADFGEEKEPTPPIVSNPPHSSEQISVSNELHESPSSTSIASEILKDETPKVTFVNHTIETISEKEEVVILKPKTKKNYRNNKRKPSIPKANQKKKQRSKKIVVRKENKGA